MKVIYCSRNSDQITNLITILVENFRISRYSTNATSTMCPTLLFRLRTFIRILISRCVDFIVPMNGINKRKVGVNVRLLLNTIYLQRVIHIQLV